MKVVAVDNGKSHLLLLDFKTHFSHSPRMAIPESPAQTNVKVSKKPHFMYDDGIFGI